MKLTAHLGKITWSLADKVLYVLYGFVQLWQVNQLVALQSDASNASLALMDLGAFSILVAVNTWIMIVSDGSALAGVIQFGVEVNERRRVNAMALLIHVVIVGVATFGVYLAGHPLAEMVGDYRLGRVADILPLYALVTIPRMFCLKLIYRDMRMKDLFVADAIWFGVRTALSWWFISNGTLTSFDSLVMIDIVGMGASSLATIVLTRKELVFGWSGGISLGTYLRYGVPLAMATALNSAPRQLDNLAIGVFFGTGVAGAFTPAKNLYRVFEQAFDAVSTLLYPAAVRMYAQQRMEDMQVLITKAISVTLIPTIIAIIALELGLSSIITVVLGPTYADAIAHFNVLILAGLGMPFLLMNSIIAAMGQSMAIVKYSALGLIAGACAFMFVVLMDQPLLVGVALVTNTLVMGVLSVAHVRREIHFPLRAVARVIDDVRHVILRKRGA